MPRGYIYVLVNSSMPGLVKVGKTTRDPTQRVAELSGATGVATPFVLAFKQLFDDCDLAELQIHYELESQGHRVSTGREFFRTETDEIIRLVLRTAAASVGSPPCGDGEDDDADILLEAQDDEFILQEHRTEAPWQPLLDEADNARYGLGGEIEDSVRALSLYKDAIRLGCLIGYERVGSMYDLGKVPGGHRKALEYFRTGAEKGNYYCWAEMASLFHENESDENATKCWKRFFDGRSARPDASVEEYPSKFIDKVCDCCVYCMLDNEHAILMEYLSNLSHKIDHYCIEEISRLSGQVMRTDRYNGIKFWLSEGLGIISTRSTRST